MVYLIYVNNFVRKGVFIIENEEKVYIVLSSTNTLLGKVIQKRLKEEYNHSSISLDTSLSEIYSFGRKVPWNMFFAGFVQESKDYGFYKLFNNSKILVLELNVSKEEKDKIALKIKDFEKNKSKYKYSLLGLILCSINIPLKRKNKYFCSQFVAEILQESGIDLFNKHSTLVKPHDFKKVIGGHVLYEGTINNYQDTLTVKTFSISF